MMPEQLLSIRGDEEQGGVGLDVEMNHPGLQDGGFLLGQGRFSPGQNRKVDQVLAGEILDVDAAPQLTEMSNADLIRLVPVVEACREGNALAQNNLELVVNEVFTPPLAGDYTVNLPAGWTYEKVFGASRAVDLGTNVILSPHESPLAGGLRITRRSGGPLQTI